MGVPDTTTFTLQDVVTDINPTTDDLVDCFADASASGFDPAYSGSKNELLNFRNYNLSLTSISGSTTSVGKPALGCTSTLDTTYYHDGASIFPVVSDIMYTDSGGTTLLVGTYRTNSLTVSHVNTTDSSGIVTAVYVC
jgi:hypothetical protein